MQQSVFKAQVRMLAEVWGERNYSAPVANLLWQAFQTINDDEFTDAVTWLVANRPARLTPPLMKELSGACDEARRRSIESRARGGGNLGEMLNEAGRVNKTADPDFVRACLQTITDFINRKCSMAQFIDNCDALDSVARQLNPTSRRANRPDTRAMQAGEK